MINMLYKKLNERTQTQSKNTIEQADDFDDSMLDKELMSKIHSLNFKTALLSEDVDWISSERGNY